MLMEKTEQTIIQAVAEEYNTSAENIFRDSRVREVTEPRHMVSLLLSDLMGYTPTRISGVIGRSRSTTTINLSRIRGLVETDPDTRRHLMNIRRKFAEDKKMS